MGKPLMRLPSNGWSWRGVWRQFPAPVFPERSGYRDALDGGGRRSRAVPGPVEGRESGPECLKSRRTGRSHRVRPSPRRRFKLRGGDAEEKEAIIVAARLAAARQGPQRLHRAFRQRIARALEAAPKTRG